MWFSDIPGDRSIWRLGKEWHGRNVARRNGSAGSLEGSYTLVHVSRGQIFYKGSLQGLQGTLTGTTRDPYRDYKGPLQGF